MHCYILYSPALDKYYIGITTEDISLRLQKHNTSLYGQHFTSQANDWEVYHLIQCTSNTQMIKIEKHIKKMKSRSYIENLKKFREIGEKLLLKYSDN